MAAEPVDSAAAYSLKLKGVEVTAQRKTVGGTTSYVMDRATLDHAQIINLSDITSLLPGGKTVNANLTDDSRFSLRSGTSERGNAAFGTAIEIDGMRLDNNAMMSETSSASTRNISSANIGSVEIISGIASVEYGDVSNGIVKINPRRGRSQWIFEASMNPYTRQVALSKGLPLHKGGTLNVSLEHANSFTDNASPYTSYQRNNLYVGYNAVFPLRTSTLRLHAAITGNVGGYNSEADPDAFVGTYTNVRDNQLRGNFDLAWMQNSRRFGVLRATLSAAFSTTDKRSEDYANYSSSSSQAYLHTMHSGYAIATDYDNYSGNGIILGPTGYWYAGSYNDQKPLTFNLKLKAEQTRQLREGIVNKLLAGIELNTSRNNGRGTYYSDLRYAPTWRPYVYSDLPTLRNLAFFLEDKFIFGSLQLTAGLRDDITMVGRSQYGTLSSLSPRFNAKYKISRNLEIYAGWGKSVKLPSFQVLYPAAAYSDKLTFTPGSTADNKAYYAYYTHVSEALYNDNLRWQYTNQIDLGADLKAGKAKFSFSAFWHRTHNPYQMVSIYTPFTYNYTSQASLEGIDIASADRVYGVNPYTGIVSVTSATTGTTLTLPSETHSTYTANRLYVNGSAVTRYGLEWIADLPIVSDDRLVGLSLRLDGSYYHYKGIDNTLIAGSPNGIGDVLSGTAAYPLIGYYAGSNVTSASSASTPSVSNGTLSKGCNVNATLTMRIPKARLIMTLKVESTFLNYKRQLSEDRSAVLLEAAGDVFGTAYNGEENHYVALYPEYYSTWDNPSERIPFATALRDASTGNAELYQQLCKLIVRSNTAYYFNASRLSSYFSCNFSVTKEIGDHISLSFYANNFLNNMSMIHSSQTNLESSLFNSGYIPRFYYGASLRFKL